MKDEAEGLTADLLFVAATRPPTRWGVPFIALLVNMIVTMEVFLVGKNPLILLLALPLSCKNASIGIGSVQAFHSASVTASLLAQQGGLGPGITPWACPQNCT